MMNTEDWPQLKRFLGYLKPHWKTIAHLCFWVTLVALLRLPIPLFTKYLIDDIIPHKNLTTLNLMGIALLAYYLFNQLSHVIKGVLLTGFKEKVIYRLQIQLLRHVLSLSNGFFQRYQSGYLASRIVNDTNRVEGLISKGAFELLLDLLTFTFGLLVMSFFHLKMTLACLALLPFYFLSLHGFGVRIKGASAAVQESLGQVLGNLQQTLSGIKVIKSFGRERREVIKHSHFIHDAIKPRVRLARLLYLSTGTTALIGSLGPLIVLWYGGSQVIEGSLSLGEMVAFMSYLSYLFGPTQKLANLGLRMKDALAALGRVFELLDTEPEIADAPGAVELREVRGEVAFDNVRFSYDGSREVLRGVNFAVQAGQIIALVGKSGAGKSTLLSLLLRFFEPTAGRVLIDAIDVRQIKLRSLLSAVAPVFQDNFLFDGSIYDNIRYGCVGADRKDVLRAAEAANAHEFIQKLPQGYESRVGEQGCTLSGGQKQRIAIARAILKGAKILILDEATAYLDSDSEKSIQEALLRLREKHTIFVVAHRLSTVRLADRVLALEGGRIVEDGARDLLEREGSRFREIFDQQLGRPPSMRRRLRAAT